ncbi:uncharacterized protein [Amphiura filiformis]|uniref:uncharacterized protein n=1 Tax=Amphiura filiformis TaxID=82378 RepID=UPI003B21BD1E
MASKGVKDKCSDVMEEEKEIIHKVTQEFQEVKITDDLDINKDQPEEVKVKESLELKSNEQVINTSTLIKKAEGKDKGQTYENLNDKDSQASVHAIDCLTQPQHRDTILGSFHQGDYQRFSESSAGKQCTVVSLVAAVDAQHNLPDQWKTADLDRVVIAGDERYNSLRLSGYPHIDEVPKFFFLGDYAIEWQVKKTFTGTLCMEDLVNLSSGLHLAFDNEGSKACALLVCNWYTTAIVKIGDFDTYALVDSHGRNADGVCDPNGKAVVLIFTSLTKLYNGLLRLFKSLRARGDTQYDLHTLAILTSTLDEQQAQQAQAQNNDDSKFDATKEREEDLNKKEGLRLLNERALLEHFLLDLVHVIDCSGCKNCFGKRGSMTYVTPRNGILSGESGQQYFEGEHYREIDEDPDPEPNPIQSGVTKSSSDETNAGSYGIVVKAIDVTTNRIFALKKLKKASEFRREEVLISWILVGSGCPDFLGVHYEVDDQGCSNIYLMFSLMLGPTLVDMMRQNYIPVTTELCVRWLRQMLCTLDRMFTHGIVHNDIHGKNIMFRTLKCQVIVLIDFGNAQQFDVYVPLGMESGKIKDKHICASSEKLPRYSKSRARLNQLSGQPWESAGAWRPNTNEQTEWIGVQFAKNTPLKGLILQGCHMEEAWVTGYQLQYRKEDGILQVVKNAYGLVQDFVGNMDSSTPRVQMLPQAIDACDMRIDPQKWHKSIALRFELLGPPGQAFLLKHDGDVRDTVGLLTNILPYSNTIRKKAGNKVQCSGDNQTAPGLLQDMAFWKYNKMGMEDWTIGDECLSASSYLNEDHAPSAARLGIKPNYGPYKPLNGWCPNLVDDWGLWIKVMFKVPQNITGIITQGHGYEKMWIEEYSMLYQTPKGAWQHVTDSDGRRMVFKGNRDNHTPMEQFFPKEVQAVAIQIQLVKDKWHQYPALRFELLGEPVGPRPPIGEEHWLARYLQALEDYKAAENAICT